MKKAVVGLGFVIFLLLICNYAFADSIADIEISINVQDAATGKEISGKKVLLGTVARVIAQYSDPSHGMPAEANLTAWINDVYAATLFSGIIPSGTIKIVDYTLSQMGTYKFKWQVGTKIDEGMVSTTVFVIPESPVGTLLGIIAPLTAFAGLAVSKRRKMLR